MTARAPTCGASSLSGRFGIVPPLRFTARRRKRYPPGVRFAMCLQRQEPAMSRCLPRPPLTLAGVVLLAIPTLVFGGDPSFNLVNRGSSAVRSLYVTEAGNPDWGRNRLRGETVAPGAVFPVQRRPDSKCVIDLRVVFADGRTEERHGLDTCTLDAVAVGGPEQALAKTHDDPSFRLVNRGTQPIMELFATLTGVPHWGRNRLEPDGLPAGAATVVRIARVNQCFYDLRIVFADHTALERRHVDLCRITDLPVP
jgi:hypothetical protein